MRKILLSTAVAVSLLGSAAQAELMITAAGGSTGDVVQFEAKFANLPNFTGDTNKGANTVEFLNLNASGTGYGPQLIGTDGQGQADIVCTGDCVSDNTGGLNGHLLNGLEIKLPAPIGATTMIFNLDFGVGSVAIVAEDNLGNLFSHTLGPGSNFFRVDAVANTNEAITDVKIFEAGTGAGGFFGWNDLKQPRIAACTLGVDCRVAPAPEPTSIAVLGVGLLGLGCLARTRKRSS
jgi:hypothetical protein